MDSTPVTTTKEWMKLDNAAKIYPAAMRKGWVALFRFSAEMSEPVDLDALRRAQSATLKRFPWFSYRLRRGFFWFYMEQNPGQPEIKEDIAYPFAHMSLKSNNGFMFHLRYYGNRIAVEIFHVLADGTGGLCFFKTLLAEYLSIKYGEVIPRDGEILDCSDALKPEECEDAYIKYAKRATKGRKEDGAYHIRGTNETDGFVHVTTGLVPLDAVTKRAKEKGVTLTEYLTAIMIMAIDKIQRLPHKPDRRLKPVKVNVPINLRKLYPTRTMRNFSFYVNPGIEPKYGQYSFDEVLRIVHHYMGMEVTEKLLNAKFSSNVQAEKQNVLRVTPLFIKNIVLRLAFERTGDRLSSSSISNLGRIELPEQMRKYISRMDVLLGPLSRTKVVCAILSYNDQLIINFTRTIKESVLEREMFRYMVKLGIQVKVESNQRYDEGGSL